MEEKEFTISGMNCNHCVMAVKKELTKLQIESSEVKIGSAKIIFNELIVTETQIEKAIVDAGFEVVK
jgi:copper chaperone